MSTVRGWAPTACLMLLAGSVSAAPPPPKPAATAVVPDKEWSADLQQWDDRQTDLRRKVWWLYSGTAALGADPRGRSLGEDVNQWVVDAAFSTQLRELRRRAEQQAHAADVHAARASLDAANKLLDTVERRFALVNAYWSMSLPRERQRALWQRLLSQAPSDMAMISRQHIDELEGVIRRDYVPSADADTVTGDMRALLEGYDSERAKLAAINTDTHTDAQLRSIPCPKPALEQRSSTLNAGEIDHPVSIRHVFDVSSFYPDEARRALITGRIILILSIDASGCELQARVSHSSGAPELDAAAIQMVEWMSFFPAQQGGRPIGSQTSLPVKFELHEAGGGAPIPK